MTSFVERPRYSCALSGAMTTVSALPRGVPILHTASGCAGNVTWTQMGGGALQVGGYCGSLSVPGTNIQEPQVVFGGVDRLREQIRHTLDVIDGDLFVVVTGCVPSMIGDDVVSVVGDFADAEKPVLVTETGVKGDSYRGYDLVLQTLFQHYTAKRTPRRKRMVNLWGDVPYWDVFWRGNLAGLRGLLEQLGLEVNSFFTGRDTLEQIRQAAAAELNIVVSDVYGIAPAEFFKRMHGTPYLVAPLPVGPTASSAFLRHVAEALDLSAALVERVIAAEQANYYYHLSTLADCYTDMDLQRHAVIVGDANYASALPQFLADDLGWLPELVVYTDQLDEDQKERLTRRHDRLPEDLRPRIVFETDTSQVLAHFRRFWPAANGQSYYTGLGAGGGATFVIGSSLDRAFAGAIGAGHLSVSFPVANRAVLDRGYTGYVGGLRLVEDLLSSAVAAR